MKFKKKSKITFGRYLGKTINKVLKTDPRYIRWCIINIDRFKVSKSVKRKVDKKIQMQDNYCDYDYKDLLAFFAFFSSRFSFIVFCGFFFKSFLTSRIFVIHFLLLY